MRKLLKSVIFFKFKWLAILCLQTLINRAKSDGFALVGYKLYYIFFMSYFCAAAKYLFLQISNFVWLILQFVWFSSTLKYSRKRKCSCVVASRLSFTTYVLATVSLPYLSRHNPRAPQSFHFGTSFHLFQSSPLRRRTFRCSLLS